MTLRMLLIAILSVATFPVASTAAFAQGQPLIRPGPCGHSGMEPVCAVKQRRLVTYINGCVAQGVGARVIAPRPCHDGCPGDYRPVCATDATGRRQTFGNACEAERSGASIVRNRGCQGVLGRR